MLNPDIPEQVFIQKPYGRNTLAQRIDEVLNSRG